MPKACLIYPTFLRIIKSATCSIPSSQAPCSRSTGISFKSLDRNGVLKKFRSHHNQLLVAIDGTEYFSSQQIHCDNCSHRALTNQKTNYFHSVLIPVVVAPGNEHVIALEPEFIVPQDGHEKQDCETAAVKRGRKSRAASMPGRGSRCWEMICLAANLLARPSSINICTLFWCAKRSCMRCCIKPWRSSRVQHGAEAPHPPQMEWAVWRNCHLSLCQPTAAPRRCSQSDGQLV